MIEIQLTMGEPRGVRLAEITARIVQEILMCRSERFSMWGRRPAGDRVASTCDFLKQMQAGRLQHTISVPVLLL